MEKKRWRGLYGSSLVLGAVSNPDTVHIHGKGCVTTTRKFVTTKY